MKATSLRLVFYGDDFTGATDALEVLSSAGLKCALFLQIPDEATLARYRGLDVIGIAGNSRSLSPDEMDAQLPAVFDWLARATAPVVHYKVCSTFDSSATTGSIGRVMEIARPRFGNACISIVAATPHLGRYCLYGNLFARSGTDGQIHRLDRHPIMSVHPITPMHEADLSVHLGQQCNLKIAKATLDDLQQGAEGLLARIAELKRSGAEAVLVDGLNAADMRAAGQALVAMGSAAAPTLVVGGSGVEHALTSAWAPVQSGIRAASVDALRPVDQVLALSGSASALSAAQIDEAVRSGFFDLALDAARLVDERGWQPYLEEVSAQAAEQLRRGRSVIMHSARGADDPRVSATLETLRSAGMHGTQAKHLGGRLLGKRLGQLVKSVSQASSLQRILISGGDTSSSIARALDIQAVEMAATLTPGAPLCRVLESGSVQGMEIAFKGGQMGGKNFFEDARRGSHA